VPLLVTYAGVPVKRWRQTRRGLALTVYDATPGRPGKRLIVSQADWAQHGEVRFYTREEMPDRRRLAAIHMSNLEGIR